MIKASKFVRTFENRQCLKIYCPKEIAYQMGFIDAMQLEYLGAMLCKSGYGFYQLDIGLWETEPSKHEIRQSRVPAVTREQ